MFFVLSKILQYVLMPVVWLTVLIVMIMIVKKPKLRRNLFIAAAAILLFFSNPFFANVFMGAWEVKTTAKSELKPHYDYGILLTGMLSYDSKYNRINFWRSSDRLLQTLDLYYDGTIGKIFITGGSGEVFNQTQKEAAILKDYLLHIGVASEDIVIETQSRNTRENALESAKILRPETNNNSYLLITSAFHMRRSAGCFRKAGFEFDVYVTDRYAGPPSWKPDHSIIPKASAMQQWTLLIHEVSGYLVYKIMGYC